MTPKRIFIFLCVIFFSYCGWGQKIILPFDTVIVGSPIIIEAKVVDVTPAYYDVGNHNRSSIFQSYILQVYKLFKGDINVKYIEIPIEGGEIGGVGVCVSDGPQMAKKGNTAIFYLRMPTDTNYAKQFYNSGDTLAHHFIAQLFYDPYNYDLNYTHPQPMLLDMEKNLYHHIENVTGIKRSIITKSTVNDTAILNWLEKTHQEELTDKEGLFLRTVDMHLSPDKSKLLFLLNVGSTSNYSTLHHLRIAMAYNPDIFGKFIVKNNCAELKNHQAAKIRYYWSEPIPEQLYNSGGYKINIADLDSSTFVLDVTAEDTSKGLLQLKNNLIASLQLSLINSIGKTGLAFIAAKTQNGYFNFAKDTITPYSYIYAEPDLDIPLCYLFPPTVESIYPLDVHCEQDTVTVKGKYLIDDKARISFYSNRFSQEIPSTYIIESSDTMLRFRVPCEFTTKYAGNELIRFSLDKEKGNSASGGGHLHSLLGMSESH